MRFPKTLKFINAPSLLMDMNGIDIGFDLNVLRVFEALHEDGSATRAALRLGVTQSAVSAALARLRRVIRERLGHGHFSGFLNSHRIAEAQTLLSDPSRRKEPVLAIAMAVGFQSIGPFNRAFKAATGCTPTAFRGQRLADS